MVNPFFRMPSLFLMFALVPTLACGGGGGTKEPVDPGKLWVQPSPAFMTPGARLIFSAVPEVHSEAPYIRTATWSVLEPNGGSVQTIGSGETATYTAPANPGTFHLKAVTEYGDSRYVPQPGTIQVVDTKGVNVSVNPALLVIIKGGSGPAPRFFSAIAPLSNTNVTWTLVEPEYQGPGLMQLTPENITRSCYLTWGNDAALDRLPGTLFHIRVQSVEVPSAFALVEVQVQR